VAVGDAGVEAGLDTPAAAAGTGAGWATASTSNTDKAPEAGGDAAGRPLRGGASKSASSGAKHASVRRVLTGRAARVGDACADDGCGAGAGAWAATAVGAGAGAVAVDAAAEGAAEAAGTAADSLGWAGPAWCTGAPGPNACASTLAKS
jgi:hypothetical protein